ncbi:hypothetical protein IC229_22820 [Spirosoma sp. BT702]|uniref:Ankyrin repeat domain-containing protein n=1 Tax=Spirosoma profusum TaxID=2771354 RepID=A0A927AS95_9BACT|nr:hypothetical protein [Spirosoma profusum]MBD2703496.1 hypothetical protein [Spirosoma profusum]
MNTSSGTLQDSINFLFWLIIYVPLNIFLMVMAALFFSLINKLLQLNFPVWALAVGAALLVFVVMASLLTTSTTNQTFYYIVTLAINLLVAVLMLTVTGITNLIFRNVSAVDFSFGKPQIITLCLYGFVTAFFAAIPLFSQGSDYLNDVQNEKQLAKLKKVIDENDIETFTEIREENYELYKVNLPGEQRPLIEYLVAADKTEMVHVLTNHSREYFTYSLRWPIKSMAMVDMLITDGMNPNKIINELSLINQIELIKKVVNKYHPDFTTSVSFITENLLKHNNIDLLDFLLIHGLAADEAQSQDTIYWLADKNDIESIKLLIKKGFKLNTHDCRLPYLAISSHNLSFLKFLFTYPFDVNATCDEYTNLETSIISNDMAIFDFLLSRNPDINTVHVTKLNGETNALRIAERYNQTEMLEKLKQYAHSVN